MRERIAWWTAVLVLAAGASGAAASGTAAPDAGPDFEALLQDKNEVLKREKDTVEAGDKKQFTVVTDEDIRELEVGAEYKSNGSFFEVVEIKSKGSDGGKFVVKRTGGKADPARRWNRVLGKGPLTIKTRETLLEWFFGSGGAVGFAIMASIAGLLLLAIVIALNSAFVYRNRRQAPAGFIREARQAVTRGDVDAFGKLADAQRGLLGGACRAMAADFHTTTVEDLQARAEVEAQRQITILRIPLKGLNLIAVVAPLLGLFGTVWGLMGCFESVSEEAASAGKSQAMADGIRIALRTTFAGLAVAVVALMVFFVFNQVLNMIVARAQGVALEISHQLARVKRGLRASASAPARGKRRGAPARPAPAAPPPPPPQPPEELDELDEFDEPDESAALEGPP